MVESDLIAIAFWNKEGAFVDGNNALLRITGHTRKDLKAGRVRWRDITPVEYRERDEHALLEIERTGRCEPYEKEFERLDGTRISVSLGATWLTGQDLGVAYFLDITDRWRAEDALRQQTRIMKSTLDSMGDGVVVADEKGKFLLFNPAAEEILRFGVSDTKPEQWAEQYQLYQPDGDTLYRTTDLPLVRAAIDGTHVDQVEMYINHHRVPEGRWISVTARPMHDDAGSLRGGVAVFRDISKQKRIEERLARDALLLGNVRDAVIVSDISGVVTYWNEGATHLFGWTADEMLGRPIVGRVSESEQQRVTEMMQLIVEQGEWIGEWFASRKDGSRIWIETRVTRITNARGQATGIMSVSHDITGRKQAAEELRIRDRAIQAVSQGILITDPRQPDNPITFVNHGFERLTGYSADEVVGRNCRFLQGPKSDPDTVSQIRDAVRNGRSCTAQLINYRKDGSEFWNELSISPVTDTDGRLIHFVGVQNDVTTRRTLEDQFRQAQKMEAVGQLAGGVAHDFNNMLAVILGYSDALRTSTHLDSDEKESVDEIHAAAQRAAALTRKLLAFSRKEVLEPKVLNLNSIVTEMEKMCRRTIGEDIELKTNLQSTLWPVKVDPSQMEQVILNLVVNARDAMPQGGSVTIETDNVEFARTDPAKPAELLAGLYVKLAAHDTGHGMDPSTMSHIFEPFFTTKEPGKGTGLGLAFVYGIVKQSMGHVAVDSAPGRGTTFTIYLPSVRGAHQTLAENQSATDVAGGRETVLLVEDEDNVRKLLARTLRKLGYEVLEACNGLEAITIYQYTDTTIDLVVTDVVMPQMSGRVLIEQLRAINPKVKMFFISGYTDDAILKQGIMELGVHFLRKPFLPLDFAAKVREVLDAE